MHSKPWDENFKLPQVPSGPAPGAVETPRCKGKVTGWGVCGDPEDSIVHRGNPANGLKPDHAFQLYPSIEDFLYARLHDAERLIEGAPEPIWESQRTLSDMIREALRFHKNWPVFVEEKPEFIQTRGGAPDALTYSVTQQIAWLTHEEYRKKFGSEPPTAPLLKTWANWYHDHEDFNPEWRNE